MDEINAILLGTSMYDDGYNQALEDFTDLLIDNLVDFGEGQNVIMAIDRGRIVRLAKQLVK